MSAKRHPELSTVPLDVEFAKTPESRRILEVGAHSLGPTARPFVLPPGTPKERVELLRRAFVDTMKDSDFLPRPRRPIWISTLPTAWSWRRTSGKSSTWRLPSSLDSRRFLSSGVGWLDCRDMRLVVIEVPRRQFLTAWKPNSLVRLSVFDKFAQGADAVRLADNVRMQSKIHDAGLFSRLRRKVGRSML